MDMDKAGIYYNPKIDSIGVGPFFTFSDLRFYIIVNESNDGTFEAVDITDKWLDEWVYIDRMSNE